MKIANYNYWTLYITDVLLNTRILGWSGTIDSGEMITLKKINVNTISFKNRYTKSHLL